MRFSLWEKHGAINSKPVFRAFATSLESAGHEISWNATDSDVDVIWSVLWLGRMAANRSIWERNQKRSKPTVVLEVGGIQRGTTWKVGLNGVNRDAYFGEKGCDDNRAEKLGLQLKPWRDTGEYILLCGQHEKSEQWRNQPPISKWLEATIEEIQSISNRPIIFRPHPRCRLPAIEKRFKNVIRQEPAKLPKSYDDYDIRFDNIYCTVSWTSNPGIHSVIQGVPAYTSQSSLAWDVSIKSLDNLDKPPFVDRQQWLNDYAWTEYTLKEIKSGLPLKRLTSKLF